LEARWTIPMELSACRRQLEFHPIWMTAFPIRRSSAIRPISHGVMVGSYSEGTQLRVTTEHGPETTGFSGPTSSLASCRPKVYSGERDGLYKSIAAMNWSRVTTLPMASATACRWVIPVTRYCNPPRYTRVTRPPGIFLHGDADGSARPPMAPSLQNGCRSDSDGLWRVRRHGSSWSVVFYSPGITHRAAV
jgi:hypothetical protein